MSLKMSHNVEVVEGKSELLPQLKDDPERWISGRTKDEAVEKACKKFNVGAADISLKRGWLTKLCSNQGCQVLKHALKLKPKKHVLCFKKSEKTRLKTYKNNQT